MCVKPNTEDSLKLEIQNTLKRVQCIVYIQRSNFKWKHTWQNRKQQRSKVLPSLLLTGDKRILWNKKHSQKLLAAMENQSGYLIKSMSMKAQQICMFLKVPIYSSCIPADLNAS